MNCDDIFFQHYTDWPFTISPVNIINIHIHVHPCIFYFASTPRPFRSSARFYTPTIPLSLSVYYCFELSHSCSFALTSRPRLLLCPRLPLHEGTFWTFLFQVQPSQFRFFLFLTARVLHGFGVLADVLLPLTPPSSAMNDMRFHFYFFVRHRALSVCRCRVIRS